MRKKIHLLSVIVINLLLAICLSELLFTGYYYFKDGKYVSVKEKLGAEKSSFDVEKQKNQACNKYKNVLAPHPYLTFVHVSRPECNSFVNNTGHRGPDVPLVKNNNNYVVMMLGGSVANQLFQFKADEMKLFFSKKYPGKNVVILNGSLEGWKQPQQLFMLQMYGDVIDAAISIEGFNEMIFNRRLDYNVRFDTPFLPGYRKANAGFLTGHERNTLWFSGKLFDMLNNNTLLSRSKTAYYFSTQVRSYLEKNINKKAELDSLKEESLEHLEKIFILPPSWSREQKRSYSIDQYIKYLALMNATAKQQQIRLAIFVQPAPAIYKPLSDDEQKLAGDLSYKDDYLLFEQEILKQKNIIPVYSLLPVFKNTTEPVYKDGIHYRQDSSGPTLVMEQIYNQINISWK